MWLEAYAQQKVALTDDFRGFFSLLPCEKYHTPRVGESEMVWEEKKMIMLCHPQGERKSLLGGTKSWLCKRGRYSYISQWFVAPQRTMVHKQTYGVKCPDKEGRVSNWGRGDV